MEMTANIDILDKNHNTPFGLAVLNGHEACALQFQQKDANCVQYLNTNLSHNNFNENAKPSWQWIVAKRKKEEDDRKRLEKEIYPILEEVVRKDWQGILYLMLEKLNKTGIGSSFAIAAGINTNRLKLTRKLVSRSRSADLYVNGDRETLLHILAKNGTIQDTDRDLCQQIVNILISKGIAYDALDKNESTALIYAAANRNLTLCKLLWQPSITTINTRTALTYTDKFDRNPFTALFWNLNEKTEFSTEMKTWAESLLEGGAQANLCSRYPIIYPVNYPGVRYLNCETNVDFISAKYTPLMMAVIAGNCSIVHWLLTMKYSGVIDVDYQDDEGKTALMHAARLVSKYYYFKFIRDRFVRLNQLLP